MNRKQNWLSWLCAPAIAALEICGLVAAYFHLGWEMFRYYTVDSNLLLLISALMWLIGEGRFLRDGVRIPTALKVFKYMATCTTTLTFMVVLTVLAPMEESYWYFFVSGEMLYLHTLCPLLALVSFLLWESHDLRLIHTLMALVPTLLYAVVAVVLNVLRIWEGPYAFLLVYVQPLWLSLVWAAVIPGGAWVLAALLRRCNLALHQEYVY